MILLVRDWISLLGCTIVTLMLKGAISYANESQKPSSAHVAAVYMDMPGVPIWPPMLVRIMMWPVCWARNCGSAALMKLTWEKKMVSNWSRTRFCVAWLVESSSTVPTAAFLGHNISLRTPPYSPRTCPERERGREREREGRGMRARTRTYTCVYTHIYIYAPSNLQHSNMSIRPKTWTASATAAADWPISRPSQRMPRIRSFHPSLSLRLLLHSLTSSRNSALRSSCSLSLGGRHATSLSSWVCCFLLCWFANGDRACVKNHV